MEHHAADELNVEVPLAERAFRALAHRREGFGQKILEALAVLKPLAELHGLAAQFLIGESRELRLKRVDWRYLSIVTPQASFIGTAEDLGCERARQEKS